MCTATQVMFRCGHYVTSDTVCTYGGPLSLGCPGHIVSKMFCMIQDCDTCKALMAAAAK